MADLKISEMVGATEVANADVVPVVQGGGNVKASRSLILTAAAGEAISLAGNGCTVEIDGAGNFSVTPAGSQPLSYGSGVLNINAGGSAFTLTNLGTGSTINDPSSLALLVAGSPVLDLGASALGFFGAAPAAQPTPAGSSAMTVAGGSGGPVFSDSAFNGGTGASAFTIEDIVTALKSLGILAS